jgi:hypothetical protein
MSKRAMPLKRHLSQHYVFLLRCWEERSQDARIAPQWRFGLENSHTGQRYGFANLAELEAFLKNEVIGDYDISSRPET